jgi:hypothetical protein
MPIGGLVSLTSPLLVRLLSPLPGPAFPRPCMPAWYSLGAVVAGRVWKVDEGARKGDERAAEKVSKLKSVVRYRARKVVRVESGEGDLLARLSVVRGRLG